MEAIANGAPASAHCANCNVTFNEQVQTFLEPARRDKRKHQRTSERARGLKQAERRRAEDAAAQALRAEQGRARQVIVERHPVALAAETAVDWQPLGQSLRTELAVLAILRYAPATSPVPAVDSWPARLAPDQLQHELLTAVYRSDLLRVHGPTCPADAFAWDTAVGSATSATPDSAQRPGPTFSSFFPSRVSWYAWQGPSLGTAATALDQHLTARAQGWLTTEVGQEDMLGLIGAVVAAETLRYFQFQLDLHNLPPVPDNHQARLAEAAARLAAVHNLGVGYNIAWRAVRNAAAAAQAKPRVPLANMTTFAVNTFEDIAAAAAASDEVTTFHEDTRLPITALSRTLFHTVLQVDPMTASVPAVTQAFAAAQSYSLDRGCEQLDAGEDPVGAAAEVGYSLHALADAGNELDAVALRQLLRDGPEKLISEWEVTAHSARILRAAWLKLAAVYDALEPALGVRGAALAVVAAAATMSGELEFRLTGGADDQGETYRAPAGQFVAEEIAAVLRTDL